MNRIDRLNAILILLQSRSRTTMDDIEDRFELSRRTIFRDIRALIETGVPIGGDAGEGYFIAEGYHLPPVVFNKEEAASLILGSKFIEKNADAETCKKVEEALTKVKAVLRYADREFVEGLENNVTIMPSPSVQHQGFPDSHLADIQFAIGSKRTLDFEYQSNYKQELTKREVEPLGLVYYSSRWHLIAHCLLREDLRDFRTDRIQKLRITTHTYDPDQHPNYLEFLNRSIVGTDAKVAWVKFTKTMARFLGEQKYNLGYVEEEELEDGIRMKFITPWYEWLARWLMSYGDQVEIESPDSLKDLMREYSTELYKHHG